jgi:hypothetical protein
MEHRFFGIEPTVDKPNLISFEFKEYERLYNLKVTPNYGIRIADMRLSYSYEPTGYIEFKLKHQQLFTISKKLVVYEVQGKTFKTLTSSEMDMLDRLEIPYKKRLWLQTFETDTLYVSEDIENILLTDDRVTGMFQVFLTSAHKLLLR